MSDYLKPASLPKRSTVWRQWTLRGYREQRDGKVKLGTWEIPHGAARTGEPRLQPGINNRSWSCDGKSERPVVLLRLGNASVGKGPWSRTCGLRENLGLIGA